MFKIFLSSVFEESFSAGFKKERQALLSLISTYEERLVATSLDNNLAISKNTLVNSLEKVYNSDMIILFLGTRYGGIREKDDIPDKYRHLLNNNETSISLTHLEYRYARELGKDVLAVTFPEIDQYEFKEDGSEGTKENVKKFLSEVQNDITTASMTPILEYFPEIYRYKKKNIYNEEIENKLSIKTYCDYLALYILHNIHHSLSTADTLTNNKIDTSKSWRIHDDIDADDNHYVIVTDISDENLKSTKQIRQDIIRSGKLNQKYLYYSAESVEGWEEWESGENKNETSRQDEEAFSQLMSSNSWLEHVEEIDTIVDLGVGVGDKCVTLLEKIQNNFTSREINLIVVDSSHYMVEVALKNITDKIKKIIHNNSTTFKYSIDGFKLDFMTIDKSKERLQGETHFKNVFMLLGGTIGNLNEESFMTSFSKVCEKGDYFILGAFLTSGTPEDLIKIESDYDNIKVKNMFAPSLKELGLDLKKVRSGWEEEQEVIIAESKRLAFTGNIHYYDGDQESEKWIELLFTTRYNYIKLCEFIETYSFKKHKCYFNNDDTFVYITFEYLGED